MQFAVAHHQDAVGVRGDFGIVGDQDDGVAVVAQALEQGQDLLARLAVQRTGGFVGQQDRRLVDQRACDGHALLLAAGQFVRAVARAFGQADRGQCLPCALGALARRHLRVTQRHGHVLQRGHARQQVEALEHEADLLAAQDRQLFGVQRGHVDAVAQVAAVGGRVQAADQVHQRGLARAGRPHDGDEVAAIHAHVHAFQRDDFRLGARGIDLAQRVRLDDRHAVARIR